jgi:hypothetical protein
MLEMELHQTAETSFLPKYKVCNDKPIRKLIETERVLIKQRRKDHIIISVIVRYSQMTIHTCV